MMYDLLMYDFIHYSSLFVLVPPLGGGGGITPPLNFSPDWQWRLYKFVI